MSAKYNSASAGQSTQKCDLCISIFSERKVFGVLPYPIKRSDSYFHGVLKPILTTFWQDVKVLNVESVVCIHSASLLLC